MVTQVSERVEFVLNGHPAHAEGIPAQTTVLDYLRDRGLTAAKEGCAEGECGACTVLMVAPYGNGSAYRAVNSCLLFVPMLAGQEIYTVESLASQGKLSEVQKAMAEGGGSQCGYCTPGFVASLFAEQYRPGRVGPCDPHQMGGNLCRCTGYRPIRDAALSLGPAPAGEFRDRLSRPAPSMDAFEFPFGFSRPATLEACFEIAAREPEARWIAGATDLAVESNLRFRRWKHLISLEAVAELREFSETSDSVLMGAGLTLNEIGELWTNQPESFREWLPLFASPTLRNRATLGGNLATASPIGDGPPLLLALDARLHLASRDGRRSVPLSSFFSGYRKTLLKPGELIAAVEIPRPMARFHRFYKVAKRRMDDISTVAGAFALDVDSRGRIEHAKFAFGGVAATPVLVSTAGLIGRPWDLAAVNRAQEVVRSSIAPISDHRGSAEYRLEIAGSLIEKFWWDTRQ